MKKEKYNYFDEFIAMSEEIVLSAQILKETLNKFDLNLLEENSEKVHELENEADKRVHQIENRLIKDFITPIDREDISLIGNRLDDIEDDIDEILINFKILNIDKIRTGINELTDLLIVCTNVVKDICLNLKNFKKIELIREKIVEINKLEEQGDRKFEKFMKDLYQNETNSVEIIKWTSIYKCFENAFDDCEKLGDFVDDVVMKNL